MGVKTLCMLLAMLLTSCGSLKKLFVHQQKLENLKSLTITGTVNRQLEQMEVLKLMDTTESTYYIEIIPIGEFSLSAGNGFTGKASTVRWKGMASKKQQVYAAKRTVQSNEVKENREVLEKQKESLMIREKGIGKIQVAWWMISVVAVYLLWKWWRYRVR